MPKAKKDSSAFRPLGAVIDSTLQSMGLSFDSDRELYEGLEEETRLLAEKFPIGTILL